MARRWKSPRAIGYILKNRSEAIRKATRAAFSTRNERKKLTSLTALSGVSVPMASAILTLTHPGRYGVIDIRVWQLLHAMESVATNPGGAGFDFAEWDQFLTILRYFAGKYGVQARDIERTLFNVHLLYQKGSLYRQRESRSVIRGELQSTSRSSGKSA